MGKVVKLDVKRCWTEEWTNKYGKADVTELTKITKVIKLKNVYKLDQSNTHKNREAYRRKFYAWKMTKRKGFTSIDRMNNKIDEIFKPIGMNIMENEEIKKEFHKWLRENQWSEEEIKLVE